MDDEKYIRPFNTVQELLDNFGYKDISKEDRTFIKKMSKEKFNKCLDDATFLDCFDVGYFCYIIHKA